MHIDHTLSLKVQWHAALPVKEFDLHHTQMMTTPCMAKSVNDCMTCLRLY